MLCKGRARTENPHEPLLLVREADEIRDIRRSRKREERQERKSERESFRELCVFISQ